MLRASDEVVILPLPGDIAAMIRAADAYLDQYGVVALLQVRGTVRLEGGHIATIPAFRSVARFDRDLGLMGFGDLDELDEELLWAFPLGPGELRVAALGEEH